MTKKLWTGNANITDYTLNYNQPMSLDTFSNVYAIQIMLNILKKNQYMINTLWLQMDQFAVILECIK